MKRFIAAAAAVLGLAAAAVALAGNGTPLNGDSANTLTLAVYGDAPYGTTPTDAQEFQATPAFVDAINGDPKVGLVLHVGDIHSGSQFCTEAYDRSVFDLWAAYKDPVVYTPGDNEWADCNKKKEGGHVVDANGDPVDYADGNPVANLALIRSIFFPQPGVTLGGRKKQVMSQAQSFDPAHPADAGYVENVMWEQSGVLFVTVDVPGGSNNDGDVWFTNGTAQTPQTQQQQDEVAQRTGADLRWLDAAFERATADRVRGVVLVEQADMWDLDGKDASHLSAYEPFVASIASHTAALGRPVLLFEGDSHRYRSDDPLVQASGCVVEPVDGGPAAACGAADDAWTNHPGYDVPNFHRVVVHGSTFPLEYLRLTVDPRADGPAGESAFGPFSWERVQP
jgi:hypothetical protein